MENAQEPAYQLEKFEKLYKRISERLQEIPALLDSIYSDVAPKLPPDTAAELDDLFLQAGTELKALQEKIKNCIL